jgi:hypothetical protein
MFLRSLLSSLAWLPARHAIPDGSGYKRETCLARMEFNPDGTIKPIDPMITPFKPGDIGQPLVNGRGRP